MDLNVGLTNFVELANQYQPELSGEMLKKRIRFGLRYLDSVSAGILPNDLILIGAATGVGKTELSTTIVLNAAAQGKKVVFFALEAHRGEIEVRTKFKLYAKILEREKKLPDGFSYDDFNLGRYRRLLTTFAPEVSEAVKAFAGVQTYYRGRNFGVKEFERVFSAASGSLMPDLVIIDHLHYFDLEDENENRGFTDVVKKIKDLSQVTSIPVVLVGHLRKQDRLSKSICPSTDEFHGTSNIGKIATKVITLASGGFVTGKPGQYYTYMRVAKSRDGGRATRYVAKVIFNSNMNEYQPEFIPGVLSANEQQWIALQENEIPNWLRERGAQND